LEIPLKYFQLDHTPNNVFFVRWHLAGLPDSVSLDTFRLRIKGNVNKELALSVNDLKTKFQPIIITAVCQCSCHPNSAKYSAFAGVLHQQNMRRNPNK